MAESGVLEEGKWRQSEEGTPQGGSISPLLANIFLHYVFDLWAARWARTQANGEMIAVRFADDLVVGFQYESDAERFRKELSERFQQFNLELHSGKTRLIEFGRHAAGNRLRRGLSKPETFDFLGFTHICATTRGGRFTVARHTIRKRLRAKLAELKAELRRRLHWPVAEVGQWLKRVLKGHFAYYGVPLNSRALSTFRWQVGRLWLAAIRRRSQKARLRWTRMQRLIDTWLPPVRLCHPWPSQRQRVTT